MPGRIYPSDLDHFDADSAEFPGVLKWDTFYRDGASINFGLLAGGYLLYPDREGTFISPNLRR